jgi:hypothetical protein
MGILPMVLLLSFLFGLRHGQDAHATLTLPDFVLLTSEFGLLATAHTHQQPTIHRRKPGMRLQTNERNFLLRKRGLD